MLADLAVTDAAAFAALVDIARRSLAGETELEGPEPVAAKAAVEATS